MRKTDKNEEALTRLIFGLAESVAEAPASELLDEAKQSGVNLLDEADEVRGILRRAGRRYLQRKLQESREEYERAVTEMQQRVDQGLPSTAAERRELLRIILDNRTEFRPIVLTAQHRNFIDLTDEDVTSFLKQLTELDLLDTRTAQNPK